MKKKNKKYALNQSDLYHCRSKRKLAKSLNVKLKDLIRVSKYPVYTTFKKDKNSKGKKREITAPANELKRVQRRIYRLLKFVDRPEYLMAGEAGKSIVTNGKYHMEDDYWIKFDISDFYPNCKREYVYQFFLNDLKCSEDVSNILTNCVTYKNSLVQGSPSSMVLSFFSFQNMFEELNMLARENNLTFSTYVDDFTFSSKQKIQIGFIAFRVSQILHAYGHKVNRKKVMYYGPDQFKRVSGVVVTPNHRLVIQNKNRKNIIDDFILIKNKENNCYHEDIDSNVRSLIGKIYSARQIEPNAFSGILRCTKEIEARLNGI